MPDRISSSCVPPELAPVVSLFRLLLSSLWSRRRVVATQRGLELTRRREQRLVPWNQLWNIRELPWLRCRPAGYPRAWRVEFAGGQSFDFIGVHDARAIVQRFWRAHQCAALHARRHFLLPARKKMA